MRFYKKYLCASNQNISARYQQTASQTDRITIGAICLTAKIDHFPGGALFIYSFSYFLQVNTDTNHALAASVYMSAASSSWHEQPNETGGSRGESGGGGAFHVCCELDKTF